MERGRGPQAREPSSPGFVRRPDAGIGIDTRSKFGMVA